MDGSKDDKSLFSSWGQRKCNSYKNQDTKEPKASTSRPGREDSQSLNFDVGLLDDDDDILARVCDDGVEDMQVGGPEDMSNVYGSEKARNASRVENLPPVPHSTPLESLPGFDVDAGQTWIYPINYPLREYQFSIVEKALFRNTLVSLPTGLGKTFIAAVVMYNFYRWYPRSKIVFMAPTKPLVAQQIEACYNIVGMPQEDTSQLTGTMAPERRVQAWAEKRVFFLTPQVLTNDLSRGACPATLIKCLVLDEAHRALGNHAYCQVVRGLRDYRHDFRILALSATPGSDLQAVQQVITNLMISHIELRSEDNPDIKTYLHQRTIDKVVVPLGEELTRLKTRYLNVLRVYVDRLLDMKVLFTRDETTLTKFQILQARDAFRQNPPYSLPAQMFGVVEGLFALCMTLYHSYELMLQHGTRSFYKFLKGTLQGDKGYSFARSQLHQNKVFQDIMGELAEKFEPESNLSQTSKHHSSQIFSKFGSPHPEKGNHDLPSVISHPKIAKLLSIVIDHHQKFADEGTSTKIMIFSQYRDSVLEITEMLQCHHPLVKAMSFIGQSSVARSGRGFSQKEQLKVVKQFREGGFNTLISTCVGEEGLDIGEVDLIICYDAPKSPIRLVQRMGRTGRKREGHIVVLVTKGKEEQMYNHSQFQKKRINAALADNGRLTQFLNPRNPSMVPKGITPNCIKLHMKVGKWKVQAGRVRKSSVNSGTSVHSLLCNSNSSPSKSKKNQLKNVSLSKEEWAWWRENLQVPTEEIKTLPQPSLTCFGTQDPEKDSISVDNINLGIYQPWQTMAQTTHIMGHSSRTLHLVQLTEFIGLQYHFDPGDDPYGLEMASFLDMAYIKGSNVNRSSLFTSIRCDESSDTQHTLKLQRSGTVKKGIGKKNSFTSKGKRTKKTVQSSLITSMLIQRPRSQIEKKNVDKCQDLVDFAIGNKKKTEEKSGSEDTDVEVIEDNDIICNVNGSTNLNDHHQVVTSPQRGIEEKISNHSKMAKLDINDDQFIVKSPSKSNSQIYNHMVDFLTLLPPKQQSPFHILTPPREVDFSCDSQEIAEPASPSDVMMVIDDWMEKKKRDNEKFFFKLRDGNLDDSGGTDTSVQTYNNVNSEAVDDSFSDLPILFKMQEKNTNEKFSEPRIIVDAIPVLGSEITAVARKIEKNMAISKTGENQEQNVTPQKIFNKASSSSDTDISPILNSTYKKAVRTKLTMYSSTPKVNAKRLFKVETPDLTVIKHHSPIFKGRESFSTPKLCRADDLREEIKSKNLGRGETRANSHAVLNQRSRIRSKLSTFAAPERLEVRDDIEPLSAPKVNICAKSSHVDTGSVNQKSKEIGVVIEKSVMGENAEEILIDGKRHHRLNDIENFRKCGNLTDLSVQEITAEINTVEDTNTKTNMIKDFEKKNNLEENSSIVYSSPKQKITKAHQVFGEANESSVLFSNEECNVTNRCEKAAEHNSKKGSVSNEVNKPAIDSSGQCSVNFSLSLDDDLFAELDVKEPERADVATPARPLSGNIRNYTVDKNIKSCASTSSVNLLSVTQILDLVDETAVDGQAKKGNDTLPTFSQHFMHNASQPVGNSSRSLISKLDERSRHKYNKNFPNEILSSKSKVDCFNTGTRTDIASNQPCKIITTSPETLKPMKDSVRPNFSLLDNILSDGESKPEEEDNHQSSTEYSVHFDLLGTDEFEPMSESLLANVDTNMQMEDHQRKQSSWKEEKANNDSGYIDTKNKGSSFTGNEIHNVVTSQKKENSQTGTRAQDITEGKSSVRLEVNSMSLLPSQNTQVWQRRKRKLCTVVESDTELSSDSESDGFRKSANSTSNKSSSFGNKDWISRKKKKNLEVKFSLEDDDDFQDDSVAIYQEVKEKLQNELKKMPSKRKKRRNEFIEEEAQVSEDGNSLSSDESDVHEGEYDCSFVDDCTQQPQDAAIDMKAVYLQSVISPLKKNHQYHRPPPRHLSDTPESIEEFDETGEDSFVVDNNFVEYDTEYIGDTMLAEDPIINQALHDKARAKKGSKRRRIILHDSSSDEESVTEKKTNNTTLLKQQSDNSGKYDVHNERAKEKSVGDIIVSTSNQSGAVQCKDHRNTKLTKEVISRLSTGEDQSELSESFKFEQSLHDKANTKKAEDTKNGSKCRRKSSSFHNSLSEEDSVAENNRIKSNAALFKLKPNYNDRPDIQSNKEKSLETNNPSVVKPSAGSENLQFKYHQNTKVTEKVIPRVSMGEDKSILSESSKSGQVATVVLVDSCEIVGGGNIVSKLRNHFGACTSVVQLKHADYAVSTRMAVTRLLHSVFSSTQQRAKLVHRVQGTLDLYDRPVIIVEMDRIKMGESPSIRKNRSRYLDTITCACTQVTQLKVLYSGGQEETTSLLWQLAEQEKTKGYSVPVLPERSTELQHVVAFYRSLPEINYPTAICLAHNFKTVADFINSSVEVIQVKCRISIHRATAIKQYLSRVFKPDMLPPQ